MSVSSLSASLTETSGTRDPRQALRWTLIGLVAALALAPLAIYPLFLMKLMCFAIFAISLNLMLGFGGMMSFGQAAFFGVGSYIAARTAKTYGLTPDLAILAGTASATLLGLAFGAVAIRRDGVYFAMITLALAQMVYFICLRAPFTGGEDGIQGVPRGALFGLIDLRDDRVLYAVVLAAFCAVIVGVYRLLNSPFGQTIKAMRDNEARAASLGYDTDAIKLTVFVIASGLAGFAGSLKAIVLQLATLTDVHWTMSGEVLLMVLVGGIGTFLGPIVGAGLVVAMQNYLAPLGSWVMVLQGLVFIATALTFRSGIIGTLRQRAKVPL